MSTPILATKLFAPPVRSKTVFRPRLFKRLDEGLQGKLTLVSAPAGFGKTTLVSAWIAKAGRTFGGLPDESVDDDSRTNRVPKVRASVAWLSLDEGDNDSTRFLTYLVAALQTLAPTVGQGVLDALHSPQPPPHESLLTALLNEIATLPEDFSVGSEQGFVLVFDDYHVLNAKPVHDILTFFLENLPTQINLIITTRQDPPLPLARYRARGQLTELRADDLRFNVDESAAFLNEMMGLTLSTEEISELETRTEGWIAGLQLVALSMQGRTDTTDFVQAFTGSHRFVLDYLVEEILERQPESIRTFLLQTAILDRLNGALCDAITGQKNGREMLATLERSNLFIVALDNERRWYRYHHLFADVLRARLTDGQPDSVPDYHRRASVWYAQHDLPADAIHHAFAAEDFERAAGLIQAAWPLMRQSHQEATLLRLVKALPNEVLSERPVLNVHYAFALAGDPDTAEAHLRDAERWLDAMADKRMRHEIPAWAIDTAQMAVVNQAELRSLPGMIAVARAYQAGALQNRADIVKYTKRALDLLPEDDYLYRGSAGVLLGLAYWRDGDLEAGHRAIADSLAIMQMSVNVSAAISTSYLLAEIEIAQGFLRQANSTCQQALRLSADHGKPERQGTADIHVVLSELHCERNELDGAAQHLLTSEKLGEHASLQVARHRWSGAMAQIYAAQGNLDDALDLLDKAAQLQSENPAPDVRPVASMKARIWIRQGRLAQALGWAQAQSLSTDDELSYLREFEHVTLARMLIAQCRIDQTNDAVHKAADLLERLLEAAEAGKRHGSTIEILILQALALEAQGDSTAALVPLQRALMLAEPEGYVRLFVDERAPMARLLSAAAVQGISPIYASQLLATFESEQQQNDDGSKRSPASSPPNIQPLIEPLTPREREVLQLMATGCSNPEIATALIISVTTVKTHVKNIYGKLQLHNRVQAVARAKELDLI